MGMKTKNIKPIIFSLVLLVLYILIQCVLVKHGLQLRAWINVSCLLAVCLGFVTGIIRLFVKTRSKKALGVLIVMVAFVILIFVTPLGIYVFSFLEQIPHKEYVYQVDGQKFVGYEDDFWDVFIDFYDYKNAFVSGTEKRFTARGHGVDEEGNLYFYDEMHRFELLEDIHRYN